MPVLIIRFKSYSVWVILEICIVSQNKNLILDYREEIEGSLNQPLLLSWINSETTYKNCFIVLSEIL